MIDWLREMRDAVLGERGRVARQVRREVYEGRPGPAPAAAFLEKVRRHAYKITDEDVEAMRAAGLSEDEIYELTIVAAMGAAMRRYEAGMRALGRAP
jgi:hypothetical protein